MFKIKYDCLKFVTVLRVLSHQEFSGIKELNRNNLNGILYWLYSTFLAVPEERAVRQSPVAAHARVMILWPFYN